MALETGNYIDNLVATNPPGTDMKAQGDDHLRLIKNALKNCFAGFTGAVVVTGTDGGAVNAYTLTTTPALIGYTTRMIAVFSPTVQNTGAATINISGLGTRPIVSVSNAALVAGDLTVGTIYAAAYDGTSFRLLSITKNYADQLAFGASLPAQAGNAGKIITTNGTIASWTDTINIPFFFGSSSPVSHANRTDEAKGADIASAATVNLSTATGNLVHITGTTAITAITIPSGAERTLVFDGILTLTNSANLILPTGANITTAVGDSCKVRGDGAAARIVSYSRADGNPLSFSFGKPTVLTPSIAVNLDSLNFVVSGANGYFIELEGIRPNTSSGSLQIQAANSGVVDTASNYQLTSTSTAVTTTEWTTSGTTDAAGKGISGVINLTNANATTPVKGLAVNTISTNSGGGSSFATIQAGAYLGGAISGLRFKWAGGLSFAATGTIRIYPIFNI